jgi:hypothetical protein
MTSPNPALANIARKIAAAFSACHELAAASTYQLADLARTLRSPATTGLTNNQRAILANTSAADLVAALHTEFASGHYDRALGRLQAEYPN